jgi:carbonic anhydrase
VPDHDRPDTPAAALAALLDGNRRFVAGSPEHPHQDAAHRAHTADGQHPFAVILGCSDSRVAAEIVFDRGLGDLFVVRTAGHMLGAEVLASLEFAVSALGAPLIVVLGHDRCGAVTAALGAHDDGATPTGFLRTIVERLGPEVLAAQARRIDDPAAVGELHVRSTAERILDGSPAIAEAVAAGRCAIVGMTYALASGQVRTIASHGLPAGPAGAEPPVTSRDRRPRPRTARRGR